MSNEGRDLAVSCRIRPLLLLWAECKPCKLDAAEESVFVSGDESIWDV